jgi:ferritin
MIDEKMQKALNQQIKEEFYSSYLYISMSAHFQAEGLSGFSNWFRIQAQEELAHTVRVFDFIGDRGGRVEFHSVEAPPVDWESPIAAFEAVLQHEQEVTARINTLIELSFEVRDHATSSFLQWFVDEQVEEEGSVQDILAKLRLVGNDGQGLFMVDQELAKRVYTPPA